MYRDININNKDYAIIKDVGGYQLFLKCTKNMLCVNNFTL